MAKGTRYGREAQEAAWQSAEVDALRKLAAAGVRVPTPYLFFEGVLLMELVTDEEGNAAPRLNDVLFTEAQALDLHARLVQEVVRMLMAGIVHGDLSEFNILLATDGPVIIDLPQAVDAAGNNHAPRMLGRDMNNLRDFFGRFAPSLLTTRYGDEAWNLYRQGLLTADTQLTGHFIPDASSVDVQSVLAEIEDVKIDEVNRRLRMGA
jgi:RIO kinase 1